MSEAAKRTVDAVQRRLGGARITEHGGVLAGAAVVPTPEQLERLMAAWHFDDPSGGWFAERAEV